MVYRVWNGGDEMMFVKISRDSKINVNIRDRSKNTTGTYTGSSWVRPFLCVLRTWLWECVCLCALPLPRDPASLCLSMFYQLSLFYGRTLHSNMATSPQCKHAATTTLTSPPPTHTHHKLPVRAEPLGRVAYTTLKFIHLKSRHKFYFLTYSCSQYRENI